MHEIIRRWADANNFLLSKQNEALLLHYTHKIYLSGKKFNLTGLKNEQDILEKLVIGSLDPVFSMNVPRGTLFIDIGSGAGIPGIPLAIVFENCHGVLVDSNHKKISFINAVIDELKLKNISALCGRIEELARGEFRNKFHCAFSRAMANMYLLVEIAAPLIRIGGFLYMYSSLNRDDLDEKSIEHCARVGMELVALEDHARFGFKENGILIQKRFETDALYPRKISLINREQKKIHNAVKHD